MDSPVFDLNLFDFDNYIPEWENVSDQELDQLMVEIERAQFYLATAEPEDVDPPPLQEE